MIRQSRVWINRIGLSLSIASLVYLAFGIATSPDPLSAFWFIVLMLLFHSGASFAVALIIGTIAAILGFAAAYLNSSPQSPVQRSLPIGARFLAGTLLGLMVGGTIGIAVGFALSPTLYVRAGSPENLLGKYAYVPVVWQPGLIVGGIWGVVNSFVLYSRRQT